MDKCMLDGQLNEWMHSCMDVGYMVDGWMDIGYMFGCMADGWMVEWMHGWMDSWMDG